ncbi:MAG: ABC transporter permease [Cryobacterium sp.]|nr:ABC transporter permease [Cryobacterium sp.]
MSSTQEKVGFWQAAGLITEREISTQLRSKSFIISTVITLVLVIGGIVLMSVLGGQVESTRIAVVGGTPPAVSAVETFDAVAAPDRAAAEQLLRDDEVAAVVLSDDSALGYSLLALDRVPSEVVAALSVSPEVELLDPQETTGSLRFLIAIAFGIVFMMAALGSGAMIMQNTVQEKQSRVVEILLAAVPARALLAGKIIGNSVIGVGNAAAIAAAAAIGLAVTGQGQLLDLLSAPMIWFVVFFLFGFVLIASIFAAGAALVSRQEDTGAVMTPAMMLVMLPYFGVVFFNDNPLAMTILSYIPFSAPVGMPVRLFFGEAMWWEPLISLALLVAATAAVVLVASKIYANSLLRMGSRVPLREALRSTN